MDVRGANRGAAYRLPPGVLGAGGLRTIGNMAWKTVSNPGDVLVVRADGAGFELISQEELDRRVAAMTPAQRAMRDAMIAGYKKAADEMRRAHEAALNGEAAPLN